MTEDEYISEFQSRWPRDVSDDVSLNTYALMDEAVHAYPLSARLWDMRGDLILLGPEECPFSLDDALACYQKAIEADPQFAQAWESIGHFYDAVLDDEVKAQQCFLEAQKLRGNAV